jgi:hypothetical protein
MSIFKPRYKLLLHLVVALVNKFGRKNSKNNTAYWVIMIKITLKLELEVFVEMTLALF